MSDSTDYLGRRQVCDAANVYRLHKILIDEFQGEPTMDVVATIETILADLVFKAAKDRPDAHAGIDRIGEDMKKYLDARFGERDQRRDQVGHG